MGDADINTLTMEHYLALTHGNQAPSVVKSEIGGNINFEIKSQFMRELREDIFLGNKNDNSCEHVERILDIFRLFNIMGVTHDAVMLCVFSITLNEAAKRWHDGSMSRRVNSDSSKGIAASTNKLDSLGRDMEKLKENVHAIQVGCENYGGAHLNKECPLGYYIRIDNRPPFGEKKPSLEELMNHHYEKSMQRRAEMVNLMKKLQESTNLNTRNQNASLKNLETQIEQLAKDYQAKAANEVPNPSVGQCKAIFANNKEPTEETAPKGTN
ncbi:hypothetical protein Tco_0650074 [Tanacetum coccineum]